MSWVCTINIKQHLTKEETPDAIKRAALAIADELDKATEQDDPIAFLSCLGLQKFAKRLRTIGETGDRDAVNGVLNALYDYGDRNRVWFGLR